MPMTISTELATTATNISIQMWIEYQIKIKKAELAELQKILEQVIIVNSNVATNATVTLPTTD